MLLRTILFASARCDMLVLQSPWIPILQDHAEDLVHAVEQKRIALRIFCGSDDEDCLPMAKQLYAVTSQKGLDVEFKLQENGRHQFPEEMATLEDLLPAV